MSRTQTFILEFSITLVYVLLVVWVIINLNNIPQVYPPVDINQAIRSGGLTVDE
jgi:hypothetical protein